MTPSSTVTSTQTPTEKRTLVDMNWDPITRIVGSLGIYTKIDFNNREVAECYSTSSIFRGYRIFMKGKDPRDAHFITSRICGICGDNHATCACYAQNMAFGVQPPAIAEWIVENSEVVKRHRTQSRQNIFSGLRSGCCFAFLRKSTRRITRRKHQNVDGI